MSFAEELRTVREERGLSLVAAARVTGVERTTLWRYETARTEPTVEAARRILAALAGASLPAPPVSRALPSAHAAIRRWVAGHPGRKVKIRCMVESSVTPWPADIGDRTDGNDGVWWSVRASIGELGVTVHARDIDAAFAHCLRELVEAVQP